MLLDNTAADLGLQDHLLGGHHCPHGFHYDLVVAWFYPDYLDQGYGAFNCSPLGFGPGFDHQAENQNPGCQDYKRNKYTYEFTHIDSSPRLAIHDPPSERYS